MDNALAVVGLETGYTPEVLDRMYADNLDHHGLFFWVDSIKKQNDRIKSK